MGTHIHSICWTGGELGSRVNCNCVWIARQGPVGGILQHWELACAWDLVVGGSGDKGVLVACLV